MVLLCATGLMLSLSPRPLAAQSGDAKPARTIVDPLIHETDVINVIFRDGQTVRLRDGRLTDLGTGALRGARSLLAQTAAGRWERVHSVAEDRLDQLRAIAQANLGRAVADLNLDFFLHLPPGLSAADAIDRFNALACVELAQPVARPVAAPLAPNYQPNQGYLSGATQGIGALCMWQLPGGTGNHVAGADLEYSWNLSHFDLPLVTLLGGTPSDPFNDDNHGTAVLGEMVGRPEGTGVTGSVYGMTMYVVAVNTGGNQNVAGAVTTAAVALGAGDVIVIEQQYPGPNYTGMPSGTQFGLVPVEWSRSIYNAIVAAVGNGITVVEAAGNGQQNLNDPIYSTGHANHWPFLPANDSGAIIVGAGAAPAGSDVDRSRLWYSNYGTTVDLQGWGEKVYSTGYGSIYSAEGKNLWYTATFSGTSSSSPIVGGACAALQSAYYAATGGSFLAPLQVRNALQATGSPQQAGANPVSQNIGPRPVASKALCLLLPAVDANTNLAPDKCEGLSGIQSCCFGIAGCTDTTPANCLANGGAPKGIGTSCAATFCGCVCPGDVRADLRIDGEDVAGFVSCMMGGGALPGIDCTCADLDGVNGISSGDLPFFVSALLSGASCN